jgi:hypothetical protein
MSDRFEAFHSGNANAAITREDLFVGFFMTSKLFRIFAEFQK